LKEGIELLNQVFLPNLGLKSGRYNRLRIKRDNLLEIEYDQIRDILYGINLHILNVQCDVLYCENIFYFLARWLLAVDIPSVG
jgi:hypothetical protein